MPDIGIVNGGTTGGIIAIIIIAIKELSMKWLGRSRGWVSKKEAKDIAAEHAAREGYVNIKEVKEVVKDHEEKERFTALVLDEKTKEVNDKLVKKVDEQDVKVKIFEHQRECQGIIRADMKEHQAQTTTLISQFQSQITTLFSQFQENNRQSIARIHARLDKIADKVGVGG
jgi:hypothetical protein